MAAADAMASSHFPPHMSSCSSTTTEEETEEESLNTVRSSATDMAERLLVDGGEDILTSSSLPGSGIQKRKAAGFDGIKRLWPASQPMHFSMAARVPRDAASPGQQASISLASVAMGSRTDPGRRLVPPMARARSEGFPGAVDGNGRPRWGPGSGIAVRFKLRELNQPDAASHINAAEASPHPNKKLAGDSSPTRRCVSFCSPAEEDSSPALVAALQRALSGAHLIGVPGSGPSPDDPPTSPVSSGGGSHGPVGSAPSSLAASPLAPKKLPPSHVAASPAAQMTPPPLAPANSAPMPPPPPMPAARSVHVPTPAVAAPHMHSGGAAPAPSHVRHAFWDFQQPQAPPSYGIGRDSWAQLQARPTYVSQPPPPQWSSDPYGAGQLGQLIPTGVPAGMMIDPSQGMMIDPHDPGYGYVYVVPEPGFYEQALASQRAAAAAVPPFYSSPPPAMAPPMAGPQMGSMQPNMMLRMNGGMNGGMPPPIQHWAAPPQQHISPAGLGAGQMLQSGAPMSALPQRGQPLSSPLMVSQQPFGDMSQMQQLPPTVHASMMPHHLPRHTPAGGVPPPQLEPMGGQPHPGWTSSAASAPRPSPMHPPPTSSSRPAAGRGQQASAVASAAAGAGNPPADGAASTNRRGAARSAAAERVRGTRLGLAVRATEQKQSRLLQQELMRMSDTQLQGACDELGAHLLELATHPFGNYVVSKLASRAQAHGAVFGALRGHVVMLLKHPQGSRVVQAAFSELPAAEGRALCEELDKHVLECALDTHGSWGVCVAFKNTHAPFIVTQMAKHINALCTQQHGVRVVQQLLHEAAAASMDISSAVASLLEGELSYLAAHPFGNYAVQAALRHAVPTQRGTMLEGLLPNILHLASSKHGSNVAEMVLTLSNDDQLEIVRALIFGPADAPPATEMPQLRTLMSSPFGNYVLQGLLRKLKEPKRALAMQLVEFHVADDNFGRAIIAAATST
jgi:pumilio RNA-binding family